jgi:Kef-type K+ transport system membrane component KefB
MSATIETVEQAVGLSGASALPLVMMTLGAIAMPSLAKRIAIPVAVAEIIYGFTIGGSGLNIVGDPNNQFIRFLSDLGFAFFLFLAGLEIDFRGIEGRLKDLILPCLLSVMAFTMSMTIAIQMDWGVWIGLAVGATSVPLLLSVVRELRLNGTHLGNTMIAFAAMGELITIALLSIVEIHTKAQGDQSKIIIGVSLLLGLVTAAIVIVVVLRALLWWFPGVFRKMVSHDDPSEFGVRVGFGMMFSFIGLSILAEVEPFLGAFIAGAMLAFVIRDKGALEHKLSSMAYGFFVPVFFIHVGIRLQISPNLILERGHEIFLLIVVMILVKLLPSMLLFFRGLHFKEVLGTTCLLAAPLTLVIAIMELAVHNDAVDEQMSAVVITAGILASLVYPSLSRRLLRGSDTSAEDLNHATG